jgi:iron complex outermembrane receptor protein
LPSTQVSAQTASSDSEIIVTARKRTESILKVPVVEAAITQEELETHQIKDLNAVATRVPGFTMGESVGTVGMQVSIRGIGPTSQTATVDQSVSLNIDGLPLSQGFAYAAGMFDVAQVEVLKGPQPLFYGKNSTAGVISLRSADPTDRFELIARAGYETEAIEKSGELIVSGPVSPSLKLRLAAHYDHSDGFFFNNGNPIPNMGSLPATSGRYAPNHELILRGTVLFDPTSNYSARLKVNYDKFRMVGSGGDGQVTFCPDGRGGVPPINVAFLQDSDCKLDRYTQMSNFDPAAYPGIRNNGVPFADSYQVFGTLEQNLRLGDDLTLTSVTGGYKMRQDNLIHGDGSSTTVFAADYTFRNKQISQELRLTSDHPDGPINFMIGGFYQYGQMQVVDRLRGNADFGLPALLQYALHKIDIHSVSAFGQLLWKIVPHVELAGGVRWTHETRDHTEFDGFNNFAPVSLLVPHLSANNVSPEISITYTPTDNLTLFGSYKQGFKSGSFNTIVYIDPNTRSDFNDEKARGFEVGLKGRTADHSLSFNLAAYRYIYSNLQVGANDLASDGTINLRTINAAAAKVQGVEFDLSYTPPSLEGLTLRLGGNYNHARYTKFDNAPCGNGQTISEGCDLLPVGGINTSQDLTGRPLVRAPNWSANASIDYETPVGSGLQLLLGTNVIYSSRYFTNLVERPEYVQNDFAKLGANIGIKTGDDRWRFDVIGKNLTNQITTGTCSNANIQNGVFFGGQMSGTVGKGPAGDDELFCVPERGREVWFRLTYKLGS